jgi:hypothetical protein
MQSRQIDETSCDAGWDLPRTLRAALRLLMALTPSARPYGTNTKAQDCLFTTP